MKITLTDGEGERLMNAEVSDEHWVTGAIEAAWAYCRYTGAATITARSNDPIATDGQDGYVRICTVGCEIHDE